MISENTILGHSSEDRPMPSPSFTTLASITWTIPHCCSVNMLKLNQKATTDTITSPSMPVCCSHIEDALISIAFVSETWHNKNNRQVPEESATEPYPDF